MDKSLSEAHGQYLRKVGYDLRPGTVAVVHGVDREPTTGALRTAFR